MYTSYINCNACKFCSATELANFVMIPVLMAASSPFSREIRNPLFGLVLALATVLASLMKTGLKNRYLYTGVFAIIILLVLYKKTYV